MNWNSPILYEQPLNELTRVCLRFEHLFSLIKHSFNQETRLDSLNALHTLSDIISLADRPELKTKFIKELSRHYANLNRLTQIPHIDHSQLNKILAQLDTAANNLNQLSGKFAHELRTNEFLNSIRLQLASPGGACTINTPTLNYWVHQSYEMRRRQLALWIEEVQIIQHVTTLILKLIRNSSVAEFKTAHHGFYDMSLDSKMANQLIRIELPDNHAVFPEVSAGRHRLCIRFLEPTFRDRDRQIDDDITFKLTCCVL